MRLMLGFIFSLTILAADSSGAFALQATSLLNNGQFDSWDDGNPVGWKVEVGINRPGKTSEIKPLDAGGVAISGDRSTRRWFFLSQSLTTQPGKQYQLSFVAKANGIKREVDQFDNCYVGVLGRNKAGKMVSQQISTVSSTRFETQKINFSSARGVDLSVGIFLSKTGKLEVQSVALQELDPNNSFDILIEDMDRNYSYFEHNQIDWKSITEKYRGPAEKARTKIEFKKVVAKMLGELNDGHVWIMENGTRTSTAKPNPPKLNCDLQFVVKQLKDVREIRKYCLTGRTKQNGFGYVLIKSMFQIDDTTFKQMCNDVRRLFDAPGLILDFRINGGGAEPVGKKLAGMFIEKPVVYAKQKYRSGPKHSDFTPASARQLSPWRFKRDDKAFTKPIICLQGPGAVSSGEGFTLMMKAIPNCKSIGLPTRGSSGNPAPVKLPNGVEVWYSRWVAMTPDETPFEGVGVQPDIRVEHNGPGDPTFERAVKMLRDQTFR